MYTVYNTKTGVSKSAKTLSSARRMADRIDNAYGAVICIIKPKNN